MCCPSGPVSQEGTPCFCLKRVVYALDTYYPWRCLRLTRFGPSVAMNNGPYPATGEPLCGQQPMAHSGQVPNSCSRS